MPRAAGGARPTALLREGPDSALCWVQGVFSSVFCFKVLGGERNSGLVLSVLNLKASQQTGLQTKPCCLVSCRLRVKKGFRSFK